MTPIEKWNRFSDYVELPLAILFFFSGLLMLRASRKASASIRTPNAQGQASPAPDQAMVRTLTWGGLIVIGISAILILVAVFERCE